MGNKGYRKAWSKSVPKAMVKMQPKGKSQDPEEGLKLAPAMKALINKEVQPKRETKNITVYYPPTPIYAKITGFNADPATVTQASMWRLFPAVAQGIKESQRVGNTIEPVSLRVHGFVYMDPSASNSTTGPSLDSSGINVRFYVMSPKKIKNYASLSLVDASGLTGYTLMAGRIVKQNGSAAGYSGTLSSHESFQTNHEEITVHHMRNYHIRRNLLLSNTEGYQVPVKIPFSFNVPLPSKVQWNSDAQITPVAQAPLIVAGWCYDNGTAPSVDANEAPKIVLTTELRYKDA